MKPKINSNHQKFIDRVEKIGYERHRKLDARQIAHLTKETPETQQKKYRFHLLLYVYENRFSLHSEDIPGHANVVTDLRDDDLRKEFDKVAHNFFRTTGRMFTFPCPICKSKFKITKIASHIEAKCCSEGYGQLIDQLGTVDREFFGEDKTVARKYYKDKYNVTSRSQLTSEQMKKEISLRKKQLNSTSGETTKKVIQGSVTLGAGILIERLRKRK